MQYKKKVGQCNGETIGKKVRNVKKMGRNPAVESVV